MVASSHHLRPSIEKGWSFSIPLAVPLEGYTTITSIQYFHCLQTAPPCMTSADDEYLGIKYLMRSFASVTFESSTPRPKFPLSLQRPFTKKYVPVHKNMCVTAFLHTDFCAMTQKSVWDSLRDPDDSHRTINLRCDTSWKLASISGFCREFDVPWWPKLRGKEKCFKSCTLASREYRVEASGSQNHVSLWH
jgi:hypothetical protein